LELLHQQRATIATILVQLQGVTIATILVQLQRATILGTIGPTTDRATRLSVVLQIKASSANLFGCSTDYQVRGFPLLVQRNTREGDSRCWLNGSTRRGFPLLVQR